MHDTALNRFKRGVHRALAGYVKHSPVAFGRGRLTRWTDEYVGRAVYHVDGLHLELSPRRLIDSYIIRTGAYAPELVAVIRRLLRQGGSVIDVGANIGYLTLIAAQAAGQRGVVYAFEPSPREFAQLLRHLELNGVMNVVPFPVAVGAERGMLPLHLAPEENPGQNSQYRTDLGARDVMVNVRPISDLMSPQGLEDVRCVKIDVEGAEMEVLKGMASVMRYLSRATFIIEVSPQLLKFAGADVDEVYRFFENHGFRPTVGRAPDTDQWDEIFEPA